MDQKIKKIWSFFKKSVVQCKYLKRKKLLQVSLEGPIEKFKEHFNFECKEGCIVVEPTVKQLLLQHIKNFDEFKVKIEKDITELKKDMAEVKNDIKIIKSLPTIQKELKEKGIN